MKDALLYGGTWEGTFDEFEIRSDQAFESAGVEPTSNQPSIANGTKCEFASTEGAVLEHGLTHAPAEASAPHTNIFEGALVQRTFDDGESVKL